MKPSRDTGNRSLSEFPVSIRLFLLSVSVRRNVRPEKGAGKRVWKVRNLSGSHGPPTSKKSERHGLRQHRSRPRHVLSQWERILSVIGAHCKAPRASTSLRPSPLGLLANHEIREERAGTARVSERDRSPGRSGFGSRRGQAVFPGRPVYFGPTARRDGARAP